MRLVIVIPARMASIRFPGKPLVDLCGKPMVQWVYEASQRSGVGDEVVVATPDQEIANACRAFGCKVAMTSLENTSGTDRVAEVASQLDADAFVNVQGDEPLIASESIRACAQVLLDNPTIQMSSVFTLCDSEEGLNPNVVKVVTDRTGNALYFSRHAIPFQRTEGVANVKKHIGIYGYTREVLSIFKTWPVGELERAESLEQLRFLENGVSIRMALGADSGIAVDTPAQADEVRAVLAAQALS